jgi:MFS family permease
MTSPTISTQTLWRHRPLQYFLYARGFSKFSAQILTVAVGWQVYALTSSAFDLGMVGLVQFLPTAILVFVAGSASDRYDRRRVIQVCQLVEAAASIFLAWGSYEGWLTVPQIFVAVAVFGVAGAFESPATAALLPAVAPDGMLQKATALATGVFQLAAISGPAIGGLAYGISPSVPYAGMAIFWIIAALLNGAIKLDRPAAVRESPTAGALFAGAHFVRTHPAILGTISLDLFAVLLGGASALLPIYARDILHTGPWGLGMLRGAQAVGALAMTVLLARHAITRRVGMRMFQAVIVFGTATVVFALSRDVWLSVLALAVMGAADTVSVVIRVSLVQLATPDDMRGRVGAVNFLFINASNQLGEFESGLTAAFLGAVPAAVIGGIGTIAVALIWMKLFPMLRNLERLE